MHQRFASLVAHWQKRWRPARTVGLGIGSASGEAILANVGSAARMDYTAIGAVVNTAARLASVAASGVTLVNGLLREQAALSGDPHIRFGAARRLRLKGFRGSLVTYACRSHRPDAYTARSRMVVDPVCGMKIEPDRALMRSHQGRRYYFCSAACRQKFRETPRRRCGPAKQRARS
jgi:YHS domain-containing protein